MPSGNIPLIYALHSGNLYGTERMALATIKALGGGFDPVIFAPPGPVLAESKRLGLAASEVQSMSQFVKAIARWLRKSKQVVFFSTRVSHSLAANALNLLFRRRVAHIHMVHGGTDEALSYGSKRRLNSLPLTLVAVSQFVRDRLLAHGAAAKHIRVIENFLTEEHVRTAPRRTPFKGSGISDVIVISRLDPIKRVGLLFDAMETAPDLAPLRVRIFGRGEDETALKARAEQAGVNAAFEGFSTQVDRALAKSDLLIHLCDREPFGLAILEAMAARVPVLVPDEGGAGSLVRHGNTGWHFHAQNPDSLVGQLRAIQAAPAEKLNAVTGAAAQELATRFSEHERGAEYRSLIEEQLQ